MKSITEIIGGGQILMNISYDIQECFEDYLTDTHRAFIAMLRVLEEHFPKIEKTSNRIGRRPYENTPLLRAFLAKAYFQIETNTELLNRLIIDSSLRKICGFVKVPSAATFSRRLKTFSEHHILEQTLYKMVRQYHSPMIVGHISRDSTAISAREKPVNKKKDVAKLKRKRGRPRKGEIRQKVKKRLTRQLSMQSGKAFKELNTNCAWGCKKNSQGKVQTWKGYKLHLDVTDMGIPVAALTTGANVHDSQVSIPLEKLTEKNVTHLYSVMDAAYDAPQIRLYSEGRGRVALIDQNKRQGDTRMPMDPAEKQRFKIRSIVERANAHLKDWLLPSKIMVRGYSKVNFTLMIGVLCLAALKILQYFILPAQESTV
jgi:transposase/IS5 family transposase